MHEPYSQEAEQGLLGSMLIRPELVEILSADLSESDFYWVDHQKVFKAITNVASRNRPVDVVTIGEYLGTMGNGDSGIAFAADLHRNTPSAANAKEYARIVKARSIDRQLMEKAKEVHELAFSSRMDTADKLAAAQAAMMKIETGSGGKDVLTAAELMRMQMEEIDRRALLDGRMDGLPTGIDALDKKLLGLKPGQLLTIAGRPKMGKTTLAMNIAAHNALAGKSVLVFSFEMMHTQLMDRMIASVGQIPLRLLQDGSVFNSHAKEMTDAAKRIMDSGLHLSDRKGLNITQIRSHARRHKLNHGLDLILVDHIGLVSGTSHNQNDVQRVSEITKGMKLLAMELGVPVIELSQLNRELERRPDKRPICSDLRDSGSIEQDSDIILFVYRDEVYNVHTDDWGKAELIIGAARDIPQCTVKVGYTGKYSRFYDLDKDAPPKQAQEKPQPQSRGLDLD